MQGQHPAADDPGFDVEGYAGNYSSHAKVEHLLFIAGATTDVSVKQEALRLALEESQKAGNVSQYKEVFEKAKGAIGEPDRKWVEEHEFKNQSRAEKLEGDLANYKTNMVKESIRMAHNDLGDFYYQIGDLQNAFKSYVRMRDYCATSKQVIQMCLAVIKVGFELGNYVHVNNYIQKAEQTPDIASDTVSQAKLKAAAALAFLKSKKYKLAAMKFTEVNADLGTHFNEVIAPQDVAVYGALCSLASFSRPEMKSRMIDNVAFREFLELLPEQSAGSMGLGLDAVYLSSHSNEVNAIMLATCKQRMVFQVRETVYAFYDSRYSTCLANLEALRPTLHLDMHIQAHVEELYSQIRSKALIQYTTPFTSVDLATMAAAFSTTVEELQKELEALIVADRIAARIDSHKGALYARHADQRNATFAFALKAGEEYLRNTKAMLLRANLQKHDFAQRSSQPRAPRAMMAERMANQQM